MARYPDDFDQDEIDEIEHQRGHRVGVEDVRFLSKRLGYRYVDWVHGLDLLDALRTYGEIPKSVKKLGRSREQLISWAMEYVHWLDVAESLNTYQRPNFWQHPGESEGTPNGVPSILAELRSSVVKKLAAGDLFAIGYIQTSDDPTDWPLWVANYDENLDFRRAVYDWEGSRLSAEFISVRIVDTLGEELLLPDLRELPKRGRGRPGMREDIRDAFYSASKQGLVFAGQSKADAFRVLKPLVRRNALCRGARIISGPGDEVLRKHTVDLFSTLNSALNPKR